MQLWADNETRVDLVGFGPLVETVAEVVTSAEMLPVTVGLFGDWGGGKTSLMAMIEDRVKACDGFLTVEFQPWLHKDYDDVRGALMVAIADALEAHRPIWEKAAGVAVEQGRAAFRNFRRRIDWLRCAMFAAKAVGTVAAAAHFNPLAVLAGAGALSDLARMFPRVDSASGGDTAKSDKDTAGLIKDDEPHLASESEQQQPLERTITEFRSEFGKLLEHLSITGLVVFVDDLDRCFPSTILDTIEAIRLFFAVPRTAFVIGSDERILRHALSTRYPETGPEATTLGREYLEKIIQVPVRIPPLSGSEVEAYLHLLILERHLGRGDTGQTRFEKLRAEALKRLHRGLGSASFNYGVIKTLYGEPLPAELDEDLAVVTQIAPVLAPQLKGNPRQAKRFLNTVYLRQRIAQRLGLSLQLPVLAKLSALEYFEESTFARLAEWNEIAPGEAEEIRALEAWASGAVQHDELPDRLKPYAIDGRFREWLRSEPKIGKIDLGPYVRFAREKLRSFGGRERALPPDVQEILVQLLDESKTVSSSARERLNEFDVGAQQLLFDALQKRLSAGISQHLFDALVAIVILNPGLQLSLVSALRAVPAPSIPAYVPSTLQKHFLRGAESKGPIRDLIASWAELDESQNLSKAAKRALMLKHLGTSSSYNPPSSPSWRAAKNAASRYASGGGQPSGRNPALPVSRFITALGGAVSAAESSRVGQGVAGGLVGFAQTAATRGLPAALQELGLTDAVGLSPEDALARIIDELALGATTIDEMAAREALEEVLRDLVEEAEDINDAFAGLDAEGVLDLLRLFVVAYIFRRFIKALGQRFRDHAVSAEAAREREEEVHRYIRDRVDYDFGDVRALQIDWKTEGARVIEELVTEAFDMLEGPSDR